MRTPYAEVLAREHASLSGITDRAMLAGWRHRIVDELMTPRSPYVLALQQTDDALERADFLDQWRELIAKTVDRLLWCGNPDNARRKSDLAPSASVDPQSTAVLILAALHGGSALSQLSRDRQPLNAALDLALAPFAASEENRRARHGPSKPT